MLPVRPERHLRPMTSVSDTSSSVDRVSVFAGRALMDELVNIALKRQRTKESYTLSFDTNILAGAAGGGVKGAKGAKGVKSGI